MTAGLTKVDATKPGSGFVNLAAALAGVGLQAPALEARAELGVHPNANTSLFAFSDVKAQWGQPVDWATGIGFRANW